jgi:HEAT repeat protein
MDKLNTKTVFIVTGLVILISLFALTFYWLKEHEAENPAGKSNIIQTNSSLSPKTQEAETPLEAIRANVINPDNLKVNTTTPLTGQAIKALITEIKSSDWRIQRKAEEGLVKIGKSAVPELMDALQEENISPPAKAIIITTLGKIGDDRAVNLLVAVLSDENSYTRRCIVVALGKIQDTNAVEPLIKTLSDEDVSVRQRAALALGKIKAQSAVMPLIEKLSDEDYRVRSSAVSALVSIGDKMAVEPLLKELNGKHDQLYKDEIVWALGELGDKKALPILEEYRKRLKFVTPRDEMVIFIWQTAVNTATEAILKLQE